MVCHNCGETVQDGFSFCMKCGVEIRHKEKKKLNLKWLIAVIAGLAAVVVIAFFIIAKLSVKTIDKDGLVYGIKWGTSKSEVQKIINGKINNPDLVERDDGTLQINFEKDSDEPFDYCIAFGFSQEQLSDVYVLYNISSETEENEQSMQKMFDKIIKDYSAKYGEYTYKVDYYIWKTPNGTVSIWDRLMPYAFSLTFEP